MSTHGKRRALGQHFLKDQGIISEITNTIIHEAEAKNCLALLEIGPGKGALTRRLLENPSGKKLNLVLCEKDSVLALNWSNEKRNNPSSSIHKILEGDFLDIPEAEWLSSRPLAVVSNLPYSSGTAIFTTLARHFDAIPVMVLMFQAEVAQRLYAVPGTKAWGSLSIWTQNRWEVKKLLSVPPQAFAPPPDVKSEVVILTPRATPRIETSLHEDLWNAFLKACFAHRRKMLRSCLPAGPYKQALEIAQIPGTKRAEALVWDEWASFFNALQKLCP